MNGNVRDPRCRCAAVRQLHPTEEGCEWDKVLAKWAQTPYGGSVPAAVGLSDSFTQSARHTSWVYFVLDKQLDLFDVSHVQNIMKNLFMLLSMWRWVTTGDRGHNMRSELLSMHHCWKVHHFPAWQALVEGCSRRSCSLDISGAGLWRKYCVTRSTAAEWTLQSQNYARVFNEVQPRKIECFKSYIMYAAGFKREMRHANYARFFVNFEKRSPWRLKWDADSLPTHSYMLTVSHHEWPLRSLHRVQIGTPA